MGVGVGFSITVEDAVATSGSLVASGEATGRLVWATTLLVAKTKKTKDKMIAKVRMGIIEKVIVLYPF